MGAVFELELNDVPASDHDDEMDDVEYQNITDGQISAPPPSSSYINNPELDAIELCDNTVNPPNTKIGPSDFELLKVLGKGGYGKFWFYLMRICSS